jgi:Glycerol-3-phosphate responsive antiterminator (mRNA-binding)
MEQNKLLNALDESPIVAAIKDRDGLTKCLSSECQVVFILFGDLVGISDIVDCVKSAGKIAMVHVDLIEGLSPKEIAIDFIAKKTNADGIITTKANLTRHAKKNGLYTVQRFFVLDSISLSNVEKQLPLENADLIEILPGVMPKIIRQLATTTGKPIIAGGLIRDKEDIINALDAGAIAISSTNQGIWAL